MINRFSKLSQPSRPHRHDLNRRRTLKKKYVLLSQYGRRVLVLSYFGFLAYGFNKHFLNPPEYTSKEEEEKSRLKFGLSDAWVRFFGYFVALRERADNKEEIK